MGKFIIFLVLVFAVFFVGGSLLFDSGIADARGISRVPVAVEVEKIYRSVKKQSDIYVVPVIKSASVQIYGLMSLGQKPQEETE